MTTDIVIVTPCLNAVTTIDQTIQSVLSQAGRFRVQYHVQDGGSTDGTWERVLWWQETLARGGWPDVCAGVRFSCHRAPDKGLYDAIVSAYAALDPDDSAFLSWINADDILFPGSFALVAAADRQFPRDMLRWVGGGAAVLRDDIVVATHDRELPTSVIRAGLCDHEHWHFVQQEGTFFRAELWKVIDPATHIRPMKLAGDWNLWRLFAHHAELIQTGRALAAFRIRDGQLSALNEPAYRAEIDSIVSPENRGKAFEALAAGEMPTRLRLEGRFASDALTLIEERVDPRLYTRTPKPFGEAEFRPSRKTRRKGTTEPAQMVEASESPSPTAADRLLHLHVSPGLIALDYGWQYPVITEQHAYQQVQAFGGLATGVTYVAYPWASLIDHLQAQGKDTAAQLVMFGAFCKRLPEAGPGPRVTVCQHVLARRFLWLFRQAGIDHIFWSHATHDDMSPPPGGPSFYPFPLYPVQIGAASPVSTEVQRRYLFSFIGARANPHYLTEVRSWILDRLADHPAGLIRGRDDWHYAKAVYHHQIWQATSPDDTALVDGEAERAFRAALNDTTFALCPSGSGPNSIRLWEALGAGAIPVILSETHALPGDPRLWADAAIFFPEAPDAVAALPGRLAQIAEDPTRIARMRAAGRQIWSLYGPGSFVTDVLDLAQELSGRSRGGAEAGSSELLPGFLTLARRILTAPSPDPDDCEVYICLAEGMDLTDAPGWCAAAMTRARVRLGVPRNEGTTPRPAREPPLTIGSGWKGSQARIYRLFLSRDADETPDACLTRWVAGDVQPLPLSDALDWPDPCLAELSEWYGRLKAVFSVEDDPLETGLLAFALGAIPAVTDVPEAFEAIIPPSARIDVTGLSRGDAARRCADFLPDAAFAAAWLSARGALRATFHSSEGPDQALIAALSRGAQP